MIKFIILSILYLNINLNLKCNGELVELKINDNWEEKREFIYLKKLKLKERFVMKTVDKNRKSAYFTQNYKIEDLRKLNLNIDKNIFITKIHEPNSKYTPKVQLKNKIVIQIANNEIIQKLLPQFEKRVFYIFRLFEYYNNIKLFRILVFNSDFKAKRDYFLP